MGEVGTGVRMKALGIPGSTSSILGYLHILPVYCCFGACRSLTVFPLFVQDGLQSPHMRGQKGTQSSPTVGKGEEAWPDPRMGLKGKHSQLWMSQLPFLSPRVWGGASQGDLGADYDPGSAGDQGHPPGRCLRVEIILPAHDALAHPSVSLPHPQGFPLRS